ncbi:MAG: hypothetical protein HYZ28_05605 [Myxococcales bacterium]|nr:hypothetical protein [Myxococcales bacterium]
MKRNAWTIGLVVLSLGCSAGRKAQWEAAPEGKPEASATSAADFLSQGDEAWNKRDEKPSLEAAIAAWEKAAVQNPSGAPLWAKLSHGYYFLADAHLRKLGTQSEEYLSTFEKGVAAGEHSLAAGNPKFKEHVLAGGSVEQGAKLLEAPDIEAAYWYASSLGKWSRAKGFATTLGNKDKIKAVMSRVLELDPDFFHGAPHRYFGAFYAVAPGFAGGDMNKSKEHFEKSLEIAPGYIGTKVLMADVYAVKKQDRALFDKLLDEALAVPDDVIPGFEPETRVEKEKAAEMKAKAGELF